MKTLADVIDRTWTRAQKLHDAIAIRLGEHGKRFIHSLYMPTKAYACKGIYDRILDQPFESGDLHDDATAKIWDFRYALNLGR
jgi:hypothetical protein